MSSKRKEPRRPPSRVRLYRRSARGARFLGVCGGLADYLGLNAALVRGLTVICLIFFFFPTVIAYFVLGWLLDTQPEELFGGEEEEEFWRSVRTAPAQMLQGLRHKFRTLELRLQSMEAAVTSAEFKMDRELGRNGRRDPSPSR